MYFLGVGVLLLVLKYMGVAPVAELPWWQVLIPFGLAALWWAWADSSGYTKRKVMDRENARKQQRIDKQRAAMGLQGSHSGSYIKRKAIDREAARRQERTDQELARQQALLDQKREAMGFQGSKKRR